MYSVLARSACAFTGRIYPFIFSSIYALIQTLQMYPGVVYTDTVFRWNWTFALFAGQQINDLNPIGPYFLMWPLYQITGEIGFYAFLQCFLLTLGILR
jgi:hypothetical protein